MKTFLSFASVVLLASLLDHSPVLSITQVNLVANTSGVSTCRKPISPDSQRPRGADDRELARRRGFWLTPGAFSFQPKVMEYEG
jgi:hypothetical protein